MSSNVINSQPNDNDQAPVQAPKGKQTLSKDELFTSSVAVMNMTAAQVAESFGSNPHAAPAFDGAALTTFMMLQQESRKEEEAKQKQKLFFEEIVSEAGDEKGKLGSGTQKAPTGKEAIFEAAGLLSDVKSKGQQSMVQQLLDQLKIMQAQLQALEQLEEFMIEFENDLEKFEKDPSFKNFSELMALLIAHFKGNPAMEKEVMSIWLNGLSAYNKEQNWKSEENTWEHKSWWYKFWHSGPGSDPHYWTNFVNGFENTTATTLESQIFQNPGLFAQFQKEGQKAFTDRIKEIDSMVQDLTMLIAILEGDGKTSLFKMEALLMDLEQTAIDNNANQSEQHKKMADAAIKGLEQTQDKLEKALKKLEKAQHHHHSGLFGWLEDLVDSIVHAIEKLIASIKDVVVGVVTGNTSEIKKGFKEFYKATGLKAIVDALKTITDGIKTGNFNEILKGFETLATAVVLTTLFGPEGLALMDTSFGKDIKSMVTLVTDAVVALGEAIGAGLCAAAGDTKDEKALLADAKKLGIKMLENPALKVLADIVMVVIIVAAVVAQQYWLAALMTVLFVMSETGLMTKATQGLTDLIEKIPGMKDSPWAKVIADVVIIAIITALSFGAGSIEAAGSVAADDVAEAGSTAAEDVADQAASNTVEDAADSGLNSASQDSTQAANNTAEEEAKSIGQKIKDAIAKVGQKIGPRLGMTLVGFGSSLGMSSLGIDLAKAIDKNDKKLEEILMIIQEVFAAISAIAGGMGVSSVEGLTGVDQRVSSAIERIAPKMVKYLAENAEELSQLAFNVEKGAMVVGGLAQVGIGGDNILTGEILKDIGKLKGETAQFDEVNKINNDAIKQNNDHLKQLMKEYDHIVDTFNAPSLMSEGIAQALMQNA